MLSAQRSDEAINELQTIVSGALKGLIYGVWASVRDPRALPFWTSILVRGPPRGIHTPKPEQFGSGFFLWNNHWRPII
jgi:hypothetical protein